MEYKFFFAIIFSRNSIIHSRIRVINILALNDHSLITNLLPFVNTCYYFKYLSLSPLVINHPRINKFHKFFDNLNNCRKINLK